MCHYVEKLLECSVPDEISAQRVRVTNEVTKSSRRVCSCLLFLITQELDQQNYARLEVLVQHIVVEARVTDSKTGELARVSVRVTATLDRSRNQSILEQFLIEEARVSTQVTDEVADFGADGRVLVHYQVLQILIDVRRVDVFVEIFGDTRQLRDQAERVNNNQWVVLHAQ